MNPAPDGSDRPVTVLVMRLRSTGKFELRRLFLAAEQRRGNTRRRPDRQRHRRRGARQGRIEDHQGGAGSGGVGIVALLREPGGRNWRVAKSVSPGSTVTVNARLGPGGLSA